MSKTAVSPKQNGQAKTAAPSSTTGKKTDFYGNPLKDPRSFYFTEGKINKIIQNGQVHWRDQHSNHWLAPIGDLSSKERTCEPNFHMATCYMYDEESNVTEKVTKKKKAAATAA